MTDTAKPTVGDLAQVLWWHTSDEEHLYGGKPTREEAVGAGIDAHDGEPFMVCQGAHFRNRTDIFDIDWVADLFDSANEEYAGEDETPAERWSGEHRAELERALNAVLKEWCERHNYHKAYSIDAGPCETITAEEIALRARSLNEGKRA
jgi:hypothetical protein